jgi:tetratricopeptide (TPR) repeat protein
MSASRFARSLLPPSLRPSHGVFIFVFLIRLIALLRLTSSPFLLPNGSDMYFYDAWAQRISHGELTDHLAFYGLPLYAYVVALLYKLFGYTPFVPGFLQAILEAGTATLIYKITVRTLGTARAGQSAAPHPPGSAPALNPASLTALLAAGGWAFFVPAQAYSVILMPTSWFVFVFWWLVWQIVKTDNAPSPLRSFGFGTVIGITAMGVATILFLVPLFLVAILVRPPIHSPARPPTQARLAAIILLLVGIGAGTAPCWFHNYFVARDPVLLSAHGGINFWLGNNPEATGYPHFPGMRAGQAGMLRDSIDQAEAAAGRKLNRSEISQFWSAKARAYIAHNPMAWLNLIARKVGNFWNGFEYDDLGVIANFRQHRVLFPGPHFAIVAALALPGLFFALRAFPRSRWIAAAILLHLAAVLPVFVTERYRLAVVPGLLFFAASGLRELWQSCSLCRFQRAGAYLGILSLAAILVTLPRKDSALWARQPYDLGRQALESGDFQRAEEQLQRARFYAPDNPETNLALGNLRLAQGNRSEAVNFYEAALRVDSTHKSALNNLGVIALEVHRPAEAKEYFRRALQQEPNNSKTHFLLAKAELALGNIAGARIALAHALEHEPDRAEYGQLREEIERRAQP